MTVSFQYKEADGSYSPNQYLEQETNEDQLHALAQHAACAKVFRQEGELKEDIRDAATALMEELEWRGEIQSMKSRETGKVIGYRLWRTPKPIAEFNEVLQAFRNRNKRA